MKIAIYGRSFKSDASVALKTLINTVVSQGVKLSIYAPFYSCLKRVEGLNMPFCESFTLPSDLKSDINFVVSLGGDGTFLEAAQFALLHEIPIIGINFGRLGFLAQIPSDQIIVAINALLEGKYQIENRTLLVAHNQDGTHYPPALNEIALQRSNPTMIKTTVRLENEILSTYWSDGLLVATPTGSTAYSLSVGGPIMLPTTQNIIITPIAPHNLNIRSLVLPDSSIIEITIETRQGQAVLNSDNHMYNVLSKSIITIQKSTKLLKFIKLDGYSFFNTLQTKLHWGADLRE